MAKVSTLPFSYDMQRYLTAGCIWLSYLVLGAIITASPAATQSIYRWQDSNGITHYSQQEPYATDYQLIRITPPKANKAASLQSIRSANERLALLCQQAIERKDLLEGPNTLYVKPTEQSLLRMLSEEERQQQLTLTLAQVERYCHQAD
ncbi:DUF4124 domain-containing protein [Arsukibacterium sp.]|uniref:DUF4124 domain-containing protein n=1 Tax=Arsukibacterium sp. TaxID=1977258 RepID=UPI002FD8CFBD